MDQTLLKKYLNWQLAYWKEIRTQLAGPLASKAELFPDIYENLSNCLIFPAEDGIVTAGFSRGFKFKELEINKWLSYVPKNKGPKYTLIDINPTPKISYKQWVQILSGNGIKITENKLEPMDVRMPLFLTDFPRLTVHDPVKKENNPFTLFTLSADKKNPSSFGLSLRNIVMTEVDTGKIIYPFKWKSLDIYSNKGIKLLTQKDAKLEASRELNGVLGGLNLGLTKEEMNQNPTYLVIEKMEELIAEFQQRLHEQTNREGPLHSFLRDNPILIAPDHIKCLYKPKFGEKYIPDFILVQASDYDDKCTLIEIEHADHKLFTKNGDPTAELNHALTQIDEWRSWLGLNARYGQDNLDLKNLHSECQAMVIIGRKSQLDQTTKKKFERLTLKSHHQTEILTYDDLLERSKQWVYNLKNLTH